jgi:hypothetical protein
MGSILSKYKKLKSYMGPAWSIVNRENVTLAHKGELYSKLILNPEVKSGRGQERAISLHNGNFYRHGGGSA